MARILFIQNFWFEFLGTMYLSSMLKKHGHATHLLIDSGEKDLVSSAAEFKPDLVGFYCTTGDHTWALETAEKIKRALDVPTIFGGPHPTFFPEMIESEWADYVCRGEGEYALTALSEALDQGKEPREIPNLWIKKNGAIEKNPLSPLIQNLDELPLPDREIYYSRYSLLKENPSKHFITGRGCPYSCSFCCNKAYNELYKSGAVSGTAGAVVRRLSPERVIREINETASRYPLKFIRFDDEVFLLKSAWLRKFLPRYADKVGLEFSCLIRADLVNEEIVKALRNAGCYTAYFGIESGNEYLRNLVLEKKISERDIFFTATLLKKHGIKIGTFNMLGIPGETLEEAYETVKINQRIKTDFPWCSIIQPYPKTQLLEYVKEKGYLEKTPEMSDFSYSYFNRSIIKNRDRERLINLHKFFHLAVKAPFMFPLIKLLIRLPPNKLYDFVFSLTFGIRYMKTYHVPLLNFLKAAFFLKDRY